MNMIRIDDLVSNWKQIKTNGMYNQAVEMLDKKKDGYRAQGTRRATDEKKLADMVNAYIVENEVARILSENGNYQVEFTDKLRDYIYDAPAQCSEPDLLVYNKITKTGILYEVKNTTPFNGIVAYINQGVMNYNLKKGCSLTLHGATRAFYYNTLDDSIYYVEFKYGEKGGLSIKKDEKGMSGLAIFRIHKDTGIKDKLVKSEDII